MQTVIHWAGLGFLCIIAAGAFAGGVAYFIDAISRRRQEWHDALVKHAQQLVVKNIAERMRRECYWFNSQRDKFLVLAIARCLEDRAGFDAQEVRDQIMHRIYNEHGLEPGQDAQSLVERAVKVLQQHITPNSGWTDKQALNAMYEIFDGPEYRAAMKGQAA